MDTVWFQLVDVRGDAYKGYPPSVAPVNDRGDVPHFQYMVKSLFGDVLKKFAAPDLVVFESPLAFAADQPLQFHDTVKALGQDYSDALIVRVPDGITRLLGPLASLPLALVDLQLDALAAKQQGADLIVNTREMHEFWEGYGGFPSSYCARKEQIALWQVVKKLLLTMDDRRIALVGSPGVGKSVFLVIVAFFMACVQKKQVLIIRNVDRGVVANAVVYLDGRGWYARATNLTPDDLQDLRKEVRDALVLVDGYPQAQVTIYNGLNPFVFLATSEYRAKQDDPTHVVVLQA